MSFTSNAMEFSCNPQYVQPNPIFKCRRAPTAAEWEALRPIFTDLYHSQGMTLPRVMQVLKQRHNFDATLKMYKNKISAWGLSKYTKQKDVDRLLKLKESLQSNGKPYEIRHRSALVNFDALERKRARAQKRGRWAINDEDTIADSDDIDVQYTESVSPYNMAGEPEVYSLIQKLLYHSRNDLEQRIMNDSFVLQNPNNPLVRDRGWMDLLQVGLDHLIDGNFVNGGTYTRHGCAILSSTSLGSVKGTIFVDISDLLGYVARCQRNGHGRVASLVSSYVHAVLNSRFSQHDPLCMAVDILLQLQDRKEDSPLDDLIRSMYRQWLPNLLPAMHCEIIRLDFLHQRDNSSFNPLHWAVSIQVGCGARDWRSFHAVSWCSDKAYQDEDWDTVAALWSQYFAALEDDESSSGGWTAAEEYKVAHGCFRLAYAQAKLDDYDSSMASLQIACEAWLAPKYPIQWLHEALSWLKGLLNWLYAQRVDDDGIKQVQFSMHEYERHLVEKDMLELQETMRELGI